MRPLKLFYSWQADHPSKIGREFIRRALDEAVVRLAAEGLTLEIDSDTQGVPGTPPVSDTILAKIRDCHLFLADVTFVAAAGEKLIPNPNVMTEYGYALRDKSARHVLLVMNTAFGPADKLPFDLRHLRHPTAYHVEASVSDAPRRAARTAFAETLSGHILAAARDVFGVRQAAEQNVREALHAAWWQAVGSRPVTQRPALVSLPSAVVHVVSAAALGGVDLDPRVVQPHARLLKLFDDAESGSDGRTWWARGARRAVPGQPNPEAGWYGQLLPSGLVEFDVNLGRRIDDDPTVLAKGTRIESQIVDAADQGLQVLQALGLDGPWAVGIVLYGLETLEIAGPRRTGRYVGQTLDLPLSIVPLGETQAGDHLRKAFDVMWMSAGFSASPSYDATQWKGYRE